MRKTGKAFIVMGLGVLSAAIGQAVLIAAVFSKSPHIPPGVEYPAAWVIGYLAGAFILPGFFGAIGNLLVWWAWKLFQHGRYLGRYDVQ
jgi:hypothetical protein